MEVGDYMRTAGEPIRLDAVIRLVDVVSALLEAELLPVVEGECLVGIIGPHDVFRARPRSGVTDWVPVRHLMSPTPARVTADTSLGEAARLMSQLGVDDLPVVDGSGRPIGVVCLTDVVRAATEMFAAQAAAA